MPRIAWRLAFWCLLSVITVMSLTPVAHLPRAFDIWDKAQHAAGFGVLTMTGVCAYHGGPWRWVVAMGLYGAGIELAQAATGWRTGDALDWVADMVGVAAALLVRAGLARRDTTGMPTPG